MSEKIKRFASVLCVLVLVLIVFIRLNSIFANQWDNQEAIRDRMEQYEELPKDSADVLFLGSSGVYAAVSPARLFQTTGITSYNLSKSNHTFYTRYYKLLNLLETKKPKLVVMDLSYITTEVKPDGRFTELEFRSGYHGLTTMKLKEEYLRNLLEDFPNIDPWSYRIPFIKHHNNWDQLTKTGFGAPHSNLKHLGGLLRSKIESVSLTEIKKSTNISEYQNKYLLKITELLAKENIDLLFVVTPRVGIQEKLHKLYRDYAAENKITFLDNSTFEFMEELGIDYSRDFYNEGHLNIWGNQKYTDYLADYIEKKYPQIKKWKPEDDAYEEIEAIWGKAVEDYKALYKEATDALEKEK